MLENTRIGEEAAFLVDASTPHPLNALHSKPSIFLSWGTWGRDMRGVSVMGFARLSSCAKNDYFRDNGSVRRLLPCCDDHN